MSVIYIAGRGHGGPGVVANACLEGTYSERLFTQRLRDKLIEHKEYITKHGDDMPGIRDWTWE